MLNALQQILPRERIRSSLLDRISFASDAGFYYLLPAVVVQPVNEQEVIALLAWAREQRMPMVFRTGGTSLSGQAVTDGILVDLSQHWNAISLAQDGSWVRVQPGITGAMVNAWLKRHQRKIGPDPSSISAAMMGGIISNNASGMCCGVAQNAYHTLRYLRFILPDGKAYTTESPGDYHRFEQESKGLHDSLLHIRERIHADRTLYARIREKFLTKTTIGYSLNAFIDHEHPLDIMSHLLVGAEGTLAFIAEAVLETVPDPVFKSTGLLFFPDIRSACKAIRPLIDAGAAMVELMDRASLRAVSDIEGMPSIMQSLPDSAAALLIEFQEEDADRLKAGVTSFLVVANGFSLLEKPAFTEDPVKRELYWKVRKGLFPAVGAVRASGTTVVLEDLAFPVDTLGEAVLSLQDLFVRYDYHNAIIFGHAKDGNIHFVITQSFNTESDIDRYDRFIRDVVRLVIDRFGGTLKAEHGTGRNMAPFVETEWGGEAYEIIKQIKKAVDPDGLLNPGVIVNDDPEVHIRHLKKLPQVEEEVDRCIECGYCEHRCPSRDITMTPRRRIVTRRLLKQFEQAGDRKTYKELLRDYQYEGLDTCAVDGLCATACPVDINTGELVKRLRRENHSRLANRAALFLAGHFSILEKGMRLALQSGFLANRLLGAGFMPALTGLISRVVPIFPRWPAQMPAPPSLQGLKNNISNDVAEVEIVYFPACLTRLMGSYPGKSKNMIDTFLSVCVKTGISVTVPVDIQGSCCSQIYGSKGYSAAQRFTAKKVVEQLWKASAGGKRVIVTDVSSCAHTLHQLKPMLDIDMVKQYEKLTILDSIEFLHDIVLPRTGEVTPKQKVVLHPVCSLEKMGTLPKFRQVAARFAKEVIVPETAGCCGMAGDRGFLFPELTAAATRAEAEFVSKDTYEGYYSSTRTCELAMSEAVHKNYESILYLVDECLT